MVVTTTSAMDEGEIAIVMVEVTRDGARVVRGGSVERAAGSTPAVGEHHQEHQEHHQEHQEHQEHQRASA